MTRECAVIHAPTTFLEKYAKTAGVIDNMKKDEISRALRAIPATNLYGFIGPMGVGKDHAAARLGIHRILKFATPLYSLATRLFSNAGFERHQKVNHGSRELLQRLGAWGRGECSEKYPLSVERALFMRQLPALIEYFNDGIGWHMFGRDPGFWVRAAMDSYDQQKMSYDTLAFTDVRYPNEAEAIQAAGGHLVLVACRLDVLAARQAKMGYTAGAGDTSEAMANALSGKLHTGQLFNTEWFREDSQCSVLWSDVVGTEPEVLDPGFCFFPDA